MFLFSLPLFCFLKFFCIRSRIWCLLIIVESYAIQFFCNWIISLIVKSYMHYITWIIHWCSPTGPGAPIPARIIRRICKKLWEIFVGVGGGQDHWNRIDVHGRECAKNFLTFFLHVDVFTHCNVPPHSGTWLCRWLRPTVISLNGKSLVKREYCSTIKIKKFMCGSCCFEYWFNFVLFFFKIWSFKMHHLLKKL